MNIIRKLKNYYFYCGIEKEEYNAVKKAAYISNYEVWKILHYLMALVFGGLFVLSFFNALMALNTWFYLGAFIYSTIGIVAFIFLKKDSLIAQLLIYLSMSVLFVFGVLINQNKVDYPATTFIVMLVLTPMFMIDKPYFMTLELSVATAVFLIWMYQIKPPEIWKIDLVNAITFTVVGSFLNIISNSLRIREFVLTRQIKIQKDTDEMTGLRNKGSLTREINEFLLDSSKNKGTLMIMDVDRFKSINDTYGHDIGDSVIIQLGHLLANKFVKDEITGRFGGDEFILFIKNTDDIDMACQIANDVASSVSKDIKLPNENDHISISIGIALYTHHLVIKDVVCRAIDAVTRGDVHHPSRRILAKHPRLAAHVEVDAVDVL